MYLYTRSTLAGLGKQLEATTFALEAAGRVEKITGVEVTVTTAIFGAPIGALTWSGLFESQADVRAMAVKLAGDADWISFIQTAGDLFATPAEDGLNRFVTEAMKPDNPFYGTTRASMAAGRYGEAATFGVTITEYMKQATGMDIAFLKSVAGGFGDVAWIVSYPTMADVDAFSDWEMSDAGYQQMLVDSAGLFIDGTGMRTMIEKLN